MAIIGIIIFVVGGIILYNIHINTKDIKLAPTSYHSLNFISKLEYEFNKKEELFKMLDEFSQSEKKDIVEMLYVITEKLNFIDTGKALPYINILSSKFRVSFSHRDIFYGNKQKEIILNFRKYERPQKLYLLFFLSDMIKQFGGLNNDELAIVQDKFVEYCQITHNQFNNMLQSVVVLQSGYL